MPTRSELRTLIRRRLADTAIDPRFDPEMIDDAIAEAIRRYSSHCPAIESRHPLVPVGARELTAPAHIDVRKVVAVIDDEGLGWSQWTASCAAPPPLPYGPIGDGYLWRAWAGRIILSRPAARTGLWRIEVARPRQVPTNDVTPIDVDDEHVPAVVAQACAILLGRDAITAGTSRAPSRAAQIDADRLLGR